MELGGPGAEDQEPIVRTLTEAQPVPIVDVASGTVTYRGYAQLGTPTSAPKWKITRTTVTGGVTLTEYADGNMLYDNIWNNRASGTVKYSR